VRSRWIWEIPLYVEDKLEEKFHNIEIRQDGNLGLVTFNYDFFINDKVTNSGVEHWQVRKIDGQWKILSFTWTSCERAGPFRASAFEAGSSSSALTSPAYRDGLGVGVTTKVRKSRRDE
jgi:hypothetical protein